MHRSELSGGTTGVKRTARACKIARISHLGFDESTFGELSIHMPMDCDLVAAIRTGAINDAAWYFSYKMGRLFYTVAAAVPMDGFASSDLVAWEKKYARHMDLLQWYD